MDPFYIYHFGRLFPGTVLRISSFPIYQQILPTKGFIINFKINKRLLNIVKVPYTVLGSDTIGIIYLLSSGLIMNKALSVVLSAPRVRDWDMT